MTRLGRWAVFVDIALVLIFAIFLWAPWDRSAQAATSSLNMVWLSLPLALAQAGRHLEKVTNLVTICGLLFAALGALMAVAGRVRGSAVIWATGFFLFAASVAILMQPWTAIGFLGTVLLVLALGARFAGRQRLQPLAALMHELWPVAYAAAFAILAWRYEPRLLIQALMVSLGLSLVSRALVPERGRTTVEPAQLPQF